MVVLIGLKWETNVGEVYFKNTLKGRSTGKSLVFPLRVGGVLSKKEIDFYVLAGEMHLAHPNRRSVFGGGRSSGMALRSPSGFFPL